MKALYSIMAEPQVEAYGFDPVALAELLVDLADRAVDGIGTVCYALTSHGADLDYDPVKYREFMRSEEADLGEVHQEAFNKDHYTIWTSEAEGILDKIGYKAALAFAVNEERDNLGGEGLLEVPDKLSRLHAYGSRLEALILDPVMLLDNVTYWLGERVITAAASGPEDKSYRMLRDALLELAEALRGDQS